MALSLNELMTFLRGEIAFCGQQGALPSDVLRFIDTFYAQTPMNTTSGDGDSQPPRKQTIDRLLQEKIWSWLVKDPEIEVVAQGFHGKRITLTEAEALSPGPTQLPNNDIANDLDSPNPMLAAEEPNAGVRLFVSEERIWNAVAGHAPDPRKVPKLDFVLLSIIASRKDEGILQGELTRLSGQDKRSVPARTQRLAERGYIEKRPVKFRGNNTSLLIHRDYSHSKDIKEQEEYDKTYMDPSKLALRITEILRTPRIMTYQDLNRRISLDDVTHPLKAMSKTIRKLEAIGIVRRVRAHSEYSSKHGKPHACVKLLRDPDDIDMKLLLSTPKQFAKLADEREDGSEAADEADASDTETLDQSFNERQDCGTDELHEVARPVARWTPDRNIHNILFDIIHRAGLRGITQPQIRQESFGPFFQRPLETILSKLVIMWQVSQPLHLRYLAVIRDTELTKTINHYVHFSYYNFEQKVRQGQVAWEGVEQSASGSKKKGKIPPPQAQPDLDKYGYPTGKPRHPQFRGGSASILECLLASKPDNYVLTSYDPILKDLGDGDYDIIWRSTGEPESSLGKELPVQKVAPRGRPPNKIKSSHRGRPRKYPPGEELYWRKLETRQQLANTRLKEAEASERPDSGTTPSKRTVDQARLDNDSDDLGNNAPTQDGSVEQNGSDNEGSTPLGKRPRKKAKMVDENLDPEGLLPIPIDINQQWRTDAERFVNRSQSGVYISPLGRRRPDGKKKGRPPSSRIAIFRSERLAELPWFSGATSVAPNREPPKTISGSFNLVTVDSVYPLVRFISSSVAHSHSPSMYAFKLAASPVDAVVQPAQTIDRRRKAVRALPDTQVSASPSSSSGTTSRRQRSQKKRQTAAPEIDILPSTQMSAQASKGVAQNTIVQPETLAHSVPQTPSIGNDTSADEEDLNKPVEDSVPEVEIVNGEYKAERQIRDSRSSQLNPWGGSMAYLRRKIIMDLLDQCGGVFPGEQQLWAPFATQWTKTGRSERVDRRTVQTAIKTLVESTRVRQLKFSFKDRKGVMVTRSIITTTSISPDDPKVKELQRKIIAEDPRPYAPPEVEVDPELKNKSYIFGTKQNRDGLDIVKGVPMDVDEVVQLDEVPLKFLRAEETKKRREELGVVSKRRKRVPKEEGAGPIPKRRRTVASNPQLPKRNVARLQKINVDKGTPHGLGTIPGFSLVSFENDLRRLAPNAASGVHHPYVQIAPSPFATGAQPPFVQFTPSSVGAPSIALANRLPYYQPPSSPSLSVQSQLPTTLDGFLADESGSRRGRRLNRIPTSFRDIVDKVMLWEIHHPKAFELVLPNFQFINHELKDPFKAVSPPYPISLDRNLMSEKHTWLGRPTYDKFPGPSDLASRWTSEVAKGTLVNSATDVPPPSSNSRMLSSAGIDPTFTAPRRRTRGPNLKISERPGTTRMAYTINKSWNVGVNTFEPPDRSRSTVLDAVTDDEVKRILTAMVVVRTLTGGVDSSINWELMEVALPQIDASTVRKIWSPLVRKYQPRLNVMKTQFQEMFLEAYEDGTLPVIDFENVKSYPWIILIDWAERELNMPRFPKEQMFPATRAQFDAKFVSEKEALPTSSDIYNSYAFVTVPERQYAASMIVHACPADNRESDQIHLEKVSRSDAGQVLARSWIRQNAVTPEDLYSADDARLKLEQIPLSILDLSTKALVAEKTIMARVRGKNAPGRFFDISEGFLATIDKRRVVTVKTIRKAVLFKTTMLDQDFSWQGYSDVNLSADDGDIMAILHLARQNRIILESGELPGNELGLPIPNPYQTRTMDKGILHFSLRLRPHPTDYVYSTNDTVRKIRLPPPSPPPCPAAPLGPDNRVPEALPLWYDINGHFFRLMWDLLLCAITGIIVIRPGLTIAEIQVQLKPVVEQWELKLCLDWMKEVGLVVQIGPSEGDGYRVDENWWLTLGTYLGESIRCDGVLVRPVVDSQG